MARAAMAARTSSCDDADPDRAPIEPGCAVRAARVRCLHAFAILPNHLHVIRKTFAAKSRLDGTETLLSANANACGRSHRSCGQVLWDGNPTKRVDDETYLWTVTRHVHPKPVRPPWLPSSLGWHWGLGTRLPERGMPDFVF